MTDLPVYKPVTLVDDTAYASSWEDQVAGSGAHVVEIDASGVADQTEFMERASDGLGLVADGRTRSWDGLQDRIWEALSQSEADAAVIVLRHADDLVDQGLAVFVEALDVFGDARRLVGDPGSGFPHPIQLYVVVTGSGPNFPKID